MRDKIFGLDTLITLPSGERKPEINLDSAATTPPFVAVVQEIKDKLRYYGSIGRGEGMKARISTEVYSQGRETIKKFVGANHSKYIALYVNNTTDGINKLASALISSHRDIVLTTRMEHHANDLPWRERCRTVYADVDNKGRLRIDHIEQLLEEYGGRIKYVAVTAASNVTGYVNDVHKIAGLAHCYGAKIIVDGAQIVAHRKFSMLGGFRKDEDIDYFIFSAHKMYSPFGGGAIVGLKDELNKHIPQFYGGGMPARVFDNDVHYADVPELYEAGSPNYIGVVGMLQAIRTLESVGFGAIQEHEQVLLARAIQGFRKINEAYGFDVIYLHYSDCDNIYDRVGILPFNLRFLKDSCTAQKLAEQAGIAVRHGNFCAHTYVDRLLGRVIPKNKNGMVGACSHEGLVRISFGIYSTTEDVDALIHHVAILLHTGKKLLEEL